MDTGMQTDDCFVMRPRLPVGGVIQISQLQLCVWSKERMFAYGPANATAIQIPCHLLLC